MAGDPYPKPVRRRASIGVQSRMHVDAVRKRIFDRDERRCVADGTFSPCWGGLTIQHAVGRGMGGSAEFDRPALLRTMCVGHNRLIEDSATFLVIALEFGWSIPRNAILPDELPPVRYPGARWYRLDDGFGRDEVWPS